MYFHPRDKNGRLEEDDDDTGDADDLSPEEARAMVLAMVKAFGGKVDDRESNRGELVRDE